MKKVEDKNFITIQGWMINELNLKGNELLIYAIIYGFSQAENQKYMGSQQYLADWTNSSRQSVINCLKSLIDKNLIVKEDKKFNGVKFVYYHTTKFTGDVKKAEGGSKKSLHNNIDNNIEDNIYINNNYNNKNIYSIDEIKEFDYDWLN